MYEVYNVEKKKRVASFEICLISTDVENVFSFFLSLKIKRMKDVMNFFVCMKYTVY